MEEKLREAFEEIGIDLELIDIENEKLVRVCDSLQYISLICIIEDKFDIVIPDELMSLDKEKNVKDFLNDIDKLVLSGKK